MSSGQAGVFHRQADYCESRSPLYAALARACAEDPLVGEIVGEARWDTALRLLGGVHYLVLAGQTPGLEGPYAGAGDPWPPFREALAAHRDWLERFVAEQAVQTNEVQRCWGLLPGFLAAALAGGRPLDLIELGASAGLNLCWDRYRYRYPEGAWGPAESGLELGGEARGGPPAELLAARAEVRRRRGIDLNPVDVASEHGARLLQSFVWADQAERLERLRRAIEIVRLDPPQLIRGDYVELLPHLLAERDEGALTVVYHSASTVYLEQDAFAGLREAIERAGAAAPLAWLSAEVPREGPDYGGYALELQCWPGGERRRLARVDHHAAWLDWLA